MGQKADKRRRHVGDLRRGVEANTSPDRVAIAITLAAVKTSCNGEQSLRRRAAICRLTGTKGVASVVEPRAGRYVVKMEREFFRN
jgi:hypothetical protein